MQEVLYRTIAQAKAAGFIVDENKLSEELAKQAKKLSLQNLDELTSLEPKGKKRDPKQEAFITAGYLQDSKVACHNNGVKAKSSSFSNSIIEHYITGVQDQVKTTPQVVLALQRNAELNESLAVPVAKPILEFLANSELKVKTPEGPKDFIAWARDKSIQLPNDNGMLIDQVFYAVQKGRQIDGQDPIEWAQINNFKIKPEIQFQYDVQQFEANKPEDRKAAIVQAAYAGKQDLLNEVARRGKVDIYEPLAEAYIDLKGKKKLLNYFKMKWINDKNWKPLMKAF